MAKSKLESIAENIAIGFVILVSIPAVGYEFYKALTKGDESGNQTKKYTGSVLWH